MLARLADAPVALRSGKVNAQRYQLKGMRRVPSGVARFEITTWYAPEAKRYIRLEPSSSCGSCRITDTAAVGSAG